MSTPGAAGLRMECDHCNGRGGVFVHADSVSVSLGPFGSVVVPVPGGVAEKHRTLFELRRRDVSRNCPKCGGSGVGTGFRDLVDSLNSSSISIPLRASTDDGAAQYQWSLRAPNYPRYYPSTCPCCSQASLFAQPVKPSTKDLDGYNIEVGYKDVGVTRTADSRIFVAPAPLTMIFRYCPQCRDHIYVARKPNRILGYLALGLLVVALPACFLLVLGLHMSEPTAEKAFVEIWILAIALTLIVHEILRARQVKRQLAQAVSGMKPTCTHASDPLILQRLSKRSTVIYSSNEQWVRGIEHLNPATVFSQSLYTPIKIADDRKAAISRYSVFAVGFIIVALIQYWCLPFAFRQAMRVAGIIQGPPTSGPPPESVRIVAVSGKWSPPIHPPPGCKSMRLLTQGAAPLRIAINGRESMDQLSSFCASCSYQFRAPSGKDVPVIVQFYRTLPPQK